jgi:hypothetical protein
MAIADALPYLYLEACYEVGIQRLNPFLD